MVYKYSQLDKVNEGFYFIYCDHTQTQPCLVKVYTNPDTNQKGIGYGIWDGCGFVPLSDLKEDVILEELEVQGKQEYLLQRTMF